MRRIAAIVGICLLVVAIIAIPIAVIYGVNHSGQQAYLMKKYIGLDGIISRYELDDPNGNPVYTVAGSFPAIYTVSSYNSTSNPTVMSRVLSLPSFILAEYDANGDRNGYIEQKIGFNYYNGMFNNVSYSCSGLSLGIDVSVSSTAGSIGNIRKSFLWTSIFPRYVVYIDDSQLDQADIMLMFAVVLDLNQPNN